MNTPNYPTRECRLSGLYILHVTVGALLALFANCSLLLFGLKIQPLGVFLVSFGHEFCEVEYEAQGEKNVRIKCEM
jgi:hypothetical protein